MLLLHEHDGEPQYWSVTANSANCRKALPIGDAFDWRPAAKEHHFVAAFERQAVVPSVPNHVELKLFNGRGRSRQCVYKERVVLTVGTENVFLSISSESIFKHLSAIGPISTFFLGKKEEPASEAGLVCTTWLERWLCRQQQIVPFLKDTEARWSEIALVTDVLNYVCVAGLPGHARECIVNILLPSESGKAIYGLLLVGSNRIGLHREFVELGVQAYWQLPLTLSRAPDPPACQTHLLHELLAGTSWRNVNTVPHLTIEAAMFSHACFEDRAWWQCVPADMRAFEPTELVQMITAANKNLEPGALSSTVVPKYPAVEGRVLQYLRTTFDAFCSAQAGRHSAEDCFRYGCALIERITGDPASYGFVGMVLNRLVVVCSAEGPDWAACQAVSCDILSSVAALPSATQGVLQQDTSRLCSIVKRFLAACVEHMLLPELHHQITTQRPGKVFLSNGSRRLCWDIPLHLRTAFGSGVTELWSGTAAQFMRFLVSHDIAQPMQYVRQIDIRASLQWLDGIISRKHMLQIYPGQFQTALEEVALQGDSTAISFALERWYWAESDERDEDWVHRLLQSQQGYLLTMDVNGMAICIIDAVKRLPPENLRDVIKGAYWIKDCFYSCLEQFEDRLAGGELLFNQLSHGWQEHRASWGRYLDLANFIFGIAIEEVLRPFGSNELATGKGAQLLQALPAEKKLLRFVRLVHSHEEFGTSCGKLFDEGERTFLTIYQRFWRFLVREVENFVYAGREAQCHLLRCQVKVPHTGAWLLADEILVELLPYFGNQSMKNKLESSLAAIWEQASRKEDRVRCCIKALKSLRELSESQQRYLLKIGLRSGLQDIAKVLDATSSWISTLEGGLRRWNGNEFTYDCWSIASDELLGALADYTRHYEELWSAKVWNNPMWKHVWSSNPLPSNSLAANEFRAVNKCFGADGQPQPQKMVSLIESAFDNAEALLEKIRVMDFTVAHLVELVQAPGCRPPDVWYKWLERMCESPCCARLGAQFKTVRAPESDWACSRLENIGMFSHRVDDTFNMLCLFMSKQQAEYEKWFKTSMEEIPRKWQVGLEQGSQLRLLVELPPDTSDDVCPELKPEQLLRHIFPHTDDSESGFVFLDWWIQATVDIAKSVTREQIQFLHEVMQQHGIFCDWLQECQPQATTPDGTPTPDDNRPNFDAAFEMQAGRVQSNARGLSLCSLVYTAFANAMNGSDLKDRFVKLIIGVQIAWDHNDDPASTFGHLHQFSNDEMRKVTLALSEAASGGPVRRLQTHDDCMKSERFQMLRDLFMRGTDTTVAVKLERHPGDRTRVISDFSSQTHNLHSVPFEMLNEVFLEFQHLANPAETGSLSARQTVKNIQTDYAPVIDAVQNLQKMIADLLNRAAFGYDELPDQSTVAVRYVMREEPLFRASSEPLHYPLNIFSVVEKAWKQCLADNPYRENRHFISSTEPTVIARLEAAFQEHHHAKSGKRLDPSSAMYGEIRTILGHVSDVQTEPFPGKSDGDYFWLDKLRPALNKQRLSLSDDIHTVLYNALRREFHTRLDFIDGVLQAQENAFKQYLAEHKLRVGLTQLQVAGCDPRSTKFAVFNLDSELPDAETNSTAGWFEALLCIARWRSRTDDRWTDEHGVYRRERCLFCCEETSAEEVHRFCRRALSGSLPGSDSEPFLILLPDQLSMPVQNELLRSMQVHGCNHMRSIVVALSRQDGYTKEMKLAWGQIFNANRSCIELPKSARTDREHYLEAIIEHRELAMVKLVQGSPRSGKSSTVRHDMARLQRGGKSPPNHPHSYYQSTRARFFFDRVDNDLKDVVWLQLDGPQADALVFELILFGSAASPETQGRIRLNRGTSVYIELVPPLSDDIDQASVTKQTMQMFPFCYSLPQQMKSSGSYRMDMLCTTPSHKVWHSKWASVLGQHIRFRGPIDAYSCMILQSLSAIDQVMETGADQDNQRALLGSVLKCFDRTDEQSSSGSFLECSQERMGAAPLVLLSSTCRVAQRAGSCAAPLYTLYLNEEGGEPAAEGILETVPVERCCPGASTDEWKSVLRKYVGAGENPEFWCTPDTILRFCMLCSFCQSSIPVVLEGETGCGKTFFVREFARLMNMHLQSFDCHPSYDAGADEDEIERWMTESVQKCKSDAERKGQAGGNQVTAVIFFDEVNCSGVSQLIKSIISDRSYFDRNKKKMCHVPSYIYIIGACNPSKSVAHASYSVLPLPVSLRHLVWKIGSATDKTLNEYIWQAFDQHLSTLAPAGSNFESVHVCRLIEKVHGFVLARAIAIGRDAEATGDTETGGCSLPSLRDIIRIMKTTAFLHAKMFGCGKCPIDQGCLNKAKSNLWASLLLALATIYMFRLPRLDQADFCKNIQENLPPECGFEAFDMAKWTTEILHKFANVFGLKENRQVIQTRAVEENLLLLFVCTMQRMPLYIIGPSGTSKSLCFTVFHDTLKNAQGAAKAFFNTFPALVVQTLQCSATLSGKTAGIFAAVVYAMKPVWRRRNDSTRILERIGLQQL
jgi:hypothetical protein